MPLGDKRLRLERHLTLLVFTFFIFNYVYASVSMCQYFHGCPCRPEEGVRCPGARGIDGCELTDEGVGLGSMCSLPLSHLFSFPSHGQIN